MTPSLPYRIMSVDPATTKSGWAILDLVSINPLKIVIVATGALDGQQLLKTRKDMATRFLPQFCVVDALIEEYVRLMQLYKPEVVVSEGAFAHLHIAALIALTLAIDALRKASKIVLDKDLIISPPTITKKAFTGSGGADKDVMRLAYQSNKYLEGVVADDLISEHEIDATAHGCSHVFRDILGTITQVSAKDRRKAKQERKRRGLKH